jgi:hypothetical protein
MLPTKFLYFDKSDARRFSFRRCLLLIALVSVVNIGCSKAPEGDQFTHLWSPQGTHIWSHLGVELIQVDAKVITPPDFFLIRELQPDMKVKLVGEIVIRYDGESLFINDRVVSEENVLIEKDGRLISNAYIKTD